MARLTVSGSATSPVSTSGAGRTAARLDARPVLKSSSTRTRAPPALSASTRWEPMKPAPPVTKQIPLMLAPCEKRALPPLAASREAASGGKGGQDYSTAEQRLDIGFRIKRLQIVELFAYTD